jgi:outer membrane protein assembly factor BamA
LDLRRYFRLWAPRRVLALKHAWTLQQDPGDNQVPFYRQVTLDRFSPLRGFDPGRFRDLGGVVFNVEYRYPIWDAIDGVFFYDVGRVFNDLGEFVFDDFHHAGGGGMNFRSADDFIFRFHVGYGGENISLFAEAATSI